MATAVVSWLIVAHAERPLSLTTRFTRPGGLRVKNSCKNGTEPIISDRMK
ncbi:unnamed protein product [Penicillium camemberti]|uniref:Str. FM013 n=1 Tax=Penicillium camemberti (strain FM 013) TaxID=1429867 RepID=A0A0G4PMA8_PENC3|nr:unnamed protein product [Penicillium camemberti]